MFHFDEIIDRKNTNSINFEGWRANHKTALQNATHPHGEDYIRMWVADMDFATPLAIRDAMKKRLDDQILGYSAVFDNTYFDILNKWFSKRYQSTIDSKEMVFSPGVVPALIRLVPLLTQEDESVLFCTPSYHPFEIAGEYNHRKVIFSALKSTESGFEMDFTDLKSKIENASNKIKLFILCNPHNPTGRVWSESELRQLGELCLANNIWIISDEIHCDLLRQGQTHIPLTNLFPDTDKIITCTAPSKTFNLAGDTLSHIFIKNEKLRETWLDLHHDMMNPLSLVATQTAYSECEDWLEALKAYLDSNFNFVKDFLQQQLPKTIYHIPEATYLGWIDLSAYANVLDEKESFSDFFISKAAVVIEDEKDFVDNAKGFIRFNAALPKARLEEGFQRMAKAINGE